MTHIVRMEPRMPKWFQRDNVESEVAALAQASAMSHAEEAEIPALLLEGTMKEYDALIASVEKQLADEEAEHLETQRVGKAYIEKIREQAKAMVDTMEMRLKTVKRLREQHETGAAEIANESGQEQA